MSQRSRRIMINRVFTVACWITAFLSVAVLAVLLVTILMQGIRYWGWDFLTNPPSRNAENAGLKPAIWGSVAICTVCALIAIPLGVGTAIFLEETRPKNRWARRAHGFVQLNIANLAGVPSIVYGIIGLTVFTQMFGVLGTTNDPSLQIGVTWSDQIIDESGRYLRLPAEGGRSETPVPVTGMTALDDDGASVELRVLAEEDLFAVFDTVDARLAEIPESLGEEEFEAAAQAVRDELLGGVIRGGEDLYVERVGERSWYYVQIPFGRSVLAGGMTLMLVVLPIVIIASQEAIRAVPSSLREGAHGLGATRWQTVRRIVLPASVPGIMTGSILAMSRAVGEAAPVLIIAGIVYITFTPQNLMDEFTAMPLQIYDWAGRPQKEFHQLASTGIIVLLSILLTFNAVAILIRQKFHGSSQ